MDKKCMSKERYKKMIKTYELMKTLVNKRGTEDTARLLTHIGLKVKPSELEVFIQK